ncbi:MAG: glycosyl transferase family 2 [Bacteroidota bacterium]|jgi:undecaprenyl-phosphate 4-deoxy-4-formamido-L-arabinose transferase|nr:glycosyl transferase family 2 [Bacteroidota bacterium]
MNPEISIVIPVYNSENILFPLTDAISEALKHKVNYEVILVNDGSKDNSWQKIKELTQNHKNITGVKLMKNSGQDNALLAGLRLSKGNYTVIMDDDFQHQPSDIITLYNECMKGYDVCYAHFSEKKQSLLKNTGSDINGRMAQVLIKKPKEIYLSPFKIINKPTINEIMKFAGPYPYIDGIILSITSNITQIDIQHMSRHNGKSNYTMSRSFSVFMKHFTGFSLLPLRIATIAGCIATFIGVCLLIKYLYDYFVTKNFVEGWTTVVVLIILFSGLILITLGIVGEYIGRMYLAVNNKPQYSISEIVKQDENAK